LAEEAEKAREEAEEYAALHPEGEEEDKEEGAEVTEGEQEGETGEDKAGEES
jgi:hypothetical protein